MHWGFLKKLAWISIIGLYLVVILVTLHKKINKTYGCDMVYGQPWKKKFKGWLKYFVFWMYTWVNQGEIEEGIIVVGREKEPTMVG